MASSRSSGLKNADATIASGINRVNAVTLITDGTNAANVILYDNTTNSGLELAKVSAAGTQNTVHVIFENPVYAEKGIYADVTGTGASYIVYFGG